RTDQRRRRPQAAVPRRPAPRPPARPPDLRRDAQLPALAGGSVRRLAGAGRRVARAPVAVMLALVHAVGAGIGECELTFLARRPIDVERARAAHAGYCACLRACGADVRLVDVSPQHPDATFIEDTFVVLDEVAVAGAMGVASRRAEVDALLPIVA